jgi:putative copper export protein
VELAALQVILDLDGWQALAIVVKTATYGATFAAAGGVFFLFLFESLITEQEDRALRRFVVHIAWIAMLLSALRIAVMNGMLSGELSVTLDPSMTRVVLESSEGTATGLRLAAFFAITMMCRNRLHGIAIWIALSAAAIAVTSFALVGHAGEVTIKNGPGLLPQGLLWLHLLAVAFWVGAFWPLHQLTRGDDIARIAKIIERFGALAIVAVSVLTGVGAVLIWLLIGKPEALWSSAYGQLFVVKLFCVALLLALAAMNKLRLTPLLLRGDPAATVRLRRSINAETVVAALILLVTASFTTVAGPVR